MLTARMKHGTFIIGLDSESSRKLGAGEPIIIDLRRIGGTDHIALIYGNTNEDLKREIEKATGAPLAHSEVKPVGGGFNG